MEKNQNIHLKLKERLGIFSLAIVFSLILLFVSFLFSDAFSELFFAFTKDDNKSKVIWIENRIDSTKGKTGAPKRPDSPSTKPPHR